MANCPYTPCLHLQRRINHQAETTVWMRLTKKERRKALLDIGTEMACFAWSDISNANFHHCASDCGQLLAHEATTKSGV